MMILKSNNLFEKKFKIIKRSIDFSMAIILLIIFFPIFVILSFLIAVIDGRPIIYVSERMKAVDEGFMLYKFRTMTPSNSNSGVSGADKASRITKTGLFLRKTRLDELPQIFNIIRGDMSFIGPRPPLRQYVDRFPEIYKEVLTSRPGVSGLASLHFHRHEELLLGRSTSAEETDRIYCRSCIPRKAKIDMIYNNNQSICFDFVLMFRTFCKIFRL